MSHDSRRLSRRHTSDNPLGGSSYHDRHVHDRHTPPRPSYLRPTLRGAVALDMDEYAREQLNILRLQTWQAPFEEHLLTYDGDESDYGFGELNPCLEGEDDESVDDVFYQSDTEKQWPDIDELEEFILEETQDIVDDVNELIALPKTSTPAVPVPKEEEAVLFGPATIKDNDTNELDPLLKNYRVNEIDQMDQMGLPQLSLRITPKPIQPWEPMPSVKKKNKEETMRFTYFREDKEKTIHSPTISGLLLRGGVGDDSLTPLRTRLKELFVPSYYSGHDRHGSTAGGAGASGSGSAFGALALGATLSLLLGGGSSTNIQGQNFTNVPFEDLAVTPFWLDILDPTEEEMKVLSKTFNIHPLTTEDIFLGEGREKVELFRNYYFVSFTSFDVVYERRILREKEKEKKMEKLKELMTEQEKQRKWLHPIKWWRNRKMTTVSKDTHLITLYTPQRRVRLGELVPLNMYMVVFKNAILTFHMSQTPHPINVRRRARLLKDHIKVLSDWISYALIDDITDSFAPMIELIEDEVNAIEDAIFKMQLLESDDSDSEDEFATFDPGLKVKWRRNLSQIQENIFFKPRKRLKLTVDIHQPPFLTLLVVHSLLLSLLRLTNLGVIRWRRQGDMMRRIGECRKRVMLVLRLLGAKADVVRGFLMKFKETHGGHSQVLMYLGDIQDHIVTMTQALNHYEKLLARSHASYLAQINIDMTKVNNDTNDVLGKLTVLGTIVLPLNVVTGLWGMNCMVPGQEYYGLAWFWGIIAGMALFSLIAYNYASKVYGL